MRLSMDDGKRPARKNLIWHRPIGVNDQIGASVMTSATPLLLSVIAAAGISVFMFNNFSSPHAGGDIRYLKTHYSYNKLEMLAVDGSPKFSSLVQACQSGSGKDCGQVMQINNNIVN